jgi:hypothetical protein
MRRLILNMVASIVIFGGGLFLTSDAQAVNECHATFCATCKCDGPCSAGIFSCECKQVEQQ